MKKILFIRDGICMPIMILVLVEISKYYDITVIINGKGQNQDLINTNLKYRNSMKIIINDCSKLKHLMIIKNTIKKNDYDLIFHHSNITAPFLFFYFYQNNHLYLHSHPSISYFLYKKHISNIMFFISAKTFKHQIVINKSILSKFRPSSKKHIVIPPFHKGHTIVNKNFKKMKLLYIGTLSLRNIHYTLEGYKKFIEQNGFNSEYIIIGSGSKEEENIIINFIQDNNLSEYIKYLGWQSDEIVKKYFEYCNVGVAFCPVTEYYLNNISFKFYEYVLSGMPVIATKLNDHIDKVNKVNGILIDDSPEGFYNGLEYIEKKLNSFSSDKIRKTLENNDYKYVTAHYIKPYIDKILKIS